ncbi:MAG: oligopeptide/dipeptide ABC transporter ATP-binding protein [Acidimicrobiales bacterium]
MAELALEARDLVKEYRGRRGRSPARALRGVSLEVQPGTTFGIVGESGCGKSTLARLLVGLEPPSAGSVRVFGRQVDMGPRADRRARARQIQLVFQDPFSSLDPRLRVRAALEEVLHVHRLPTGARTSTERVGDLLEMVALGERFADRYPHELSGGQAQRVAIARGLAAEPAVLVLDEPTSALDVSVRAEIMNLLVRIQDELGLSYLFISHDLGMVRHISDEIAVLYLGRVVERGSFSQVLDAPLHPYTRALADAVPVPDPEVESARSTVASAAVLLEEPAAGCPYRPRCALAEPDCALVAPDLVFAEPGHLVACHVATRSVTPVRLRGAPSSP